MCEALKDTYQLFEEIGRGKFGTVLRCFSPTRNDFFACKLVEKRLLVDPSDCECLKTEPKIMTLLSPHPNIVQIIDAIDSEDSLCVVMELCRADTLYDRMVTQHVLSEAEAAAYMKQLLQALAHCHSLGVVHRDVKPENLLFGLNGRLKLADFGSAVLSFLHGGKAMLEWVVGTPYYVAPEVLMGRLYDERVDIWSAGVVMYIMLSGIPPFDGESAQEIFEAVVRSNLRFPPRAFRFVSSAAKDLMRKMVCRDVSRRLSAEQALCHPWILNGGDTSSMTDMTG
ncbi:hypothetical protein SAY87_009259 [Trapa incisa]|uniref:Protein kinase domain-containing protein n=1 Tax=Trapa incisa TaxID=236973 RepID=A0AAN7JYF8_9MYRT|nr:hypothetical protein SAY87_009259 [Trapa incisa]